jgi:hypothetical protein
VRVREGDDRHDATWQALVGSEPECNKNDDLKKLYVFLSSTISQFLNPFEPNNFVNLCA